VSSVRRRLWSAEEASSEEALEEGTELRRASGAGGGDGKEEGDATFQRNEVLSFTAYLGILRFSCADPVR
jgi:hypothetical protein